ncbi:MAG: hypothetical protein AB7I42_28985 [Bradyrhizobium sp.]|uniref:hypothetical protein n=1 Tax=Bradyrhizobium sp. TaxID=376 RepID=UPI003D13E3DA
MSGKATGLASFKAAPKEASARPQRKRAQGETVALTVRLPRSEWARLHQLAVDEGVSLQALAVTGLSKVFEERGLPPVEA